MVPYLGSQSFKPLLTDDRNVEEAGTVRLAQMSRLLQAMRLAGAPFMHLLKFFRARPHVALPMNARGFLTACKEMAFWSASDAGLEGAIEAFDGSVLHRAADGLCTIRMTLRDSQPARSPAEAAAAIFRALHGLRILLLLEINGCRFVNVAPNFNPGVRELGQNYTDFLELAG